jgi:hypothetical protein
MAFLAYSVWRSEETTDGDLSYQQVFVTENGQVKPAFVSERTPQPQPAQTTMSPSPDQNGHDQRLTRV